MRIFLFAFAFWLLSTLAPEAQSGAPKGISPCAAASLSVSGTSSNVQLSQCGPSVILMNITSQEAFFNIGKASTTAATTSNYSIPGGAYLVIVVPTLDTAGWYLAAITSTSTTTIRVIQGNAQ
jgi:hypothetical protein